MGNTDNIVSFSVKDTGIGIEPDKHKDLFAEFSTIDSSYANKFGGTGLGLAICKGLVENMNGEIGLSSNIGKGSKFWFNLDLKATDEAEKLGNEENFNKIQTSSLSDIKVLIAEDNKTNQLVTSRYLEYFECEFEIANNGLEAVEKVMLNDFDIILMDISMPKMNGFEATAKIRNIENEKKRVLPIIAFTAYASKEDQDKMLEAGMNGFIPKPFSREQLAQVIVENIDIVPKEKSISSEVTSVADISDFDLAVLDTILEDMEPSAITHIFDEFNNDVQRYLSNAKDGLQNQNPEVIEKASHGIQGVSGMFGAMELSLLASQVNQICLSDDHNNLYEETSQFIEKTKEIIQVTKHVENHYLGKIESSN